MIDFHAHVYPDPIAARAVEAVSTFYDDCPCHGDGTLNGYLQAQQRAGIAQSLICSVATFPNQVPRINEFIAGCVAAHPTRLFGFAAAFPGGDDWQGQLDHAKELGLIGVKLHPDFQKFNADAPEAMELYAAMEGNMALLLHAGDPRCDTSHPRRIANIKRAFPNLTVIAAHLGGWASWDEAAENLADLDVWVDTSSSLPFCPPETFARMVRAYPADRILFGSDWPMWDPEQELQAQVPLFPQEWAQKILQDNGETLLRTLR